MSEFKGPGRPNFGGRDGNGGGFRRGGPGGGGGRPSFGGNRGGGGGRGFGGGAPRGQMFEAVCANCGKTCEVPFRPNGKKPVYCAECFATMGGGERGERGGDRRSDFKVEHRDYRKPPARSTKYDHLAPFPYEKDERIDDIREKLDILGMKLDTLLKESASATRGTKTTRPASKTKSPRAKK